MCNPTSAKEETESVSKNHVREAKERNSDQGKFKTKWV